MAAAAAPPPPRYRSLHLVVVVAAFFLATSGCAAAAGGAAGDHVVLLNVGSLFTSGSPCSTPREHRSGVGSTPTRMEIVHRHGPCSPVADVHGKAPSHGEVLAADQDRVESIQRRVSASAGGGEAPRSAAPVELTPKSVDGTQHSHHPSPAATGSSSSTSSSSSSSTSLPAYSGVALGTGNYVVTIGLGTPASRFTVVFDTGSDTTWVQCRPCVVACYKQREPLFDPAKSSTYANMSCASSSCAYLAVRGCSGGHCLYAVQYGDGSSTVGFYAQDTLTVSHDVVKGFRFGCGEKNSGLFGETAGLMGLGRGKTSVVVQTYAKYGGVFSYCLPASSAGTGYLDLGGGAAAANARLTPMLTENGPTFYYVGLTGIRVGGQQVDVPESVFSKAGTLVDSGTVITRLPPKAYGALSSAFAAAMSNAGYKKAAPYSILDTCYDFTGLDEVAVPTVSLVFEGGACLDVDASGILYPISVAQMCLAFAGNDDDDSVGIVGNTQQKTYGVLYDLGRKVVGFAPGAC